jgi:predicted kinase
MAHVTLMVGPPGSGKSTYARRVPNATVISTDAFREGEADNYGHLLASSYKKLNHALAEGKDCVFDSPSANPVIRRAVRNIARKHGASISAAIMQTGLETCVKAQRERGPAAVPRAAVERIHENIQRQLPAICKEGYDGIGFVRRK